MLTIYRNAQRANCKPFDSVAPSSLSAETLANAFVWVSDGMMNPTHPALMDARVSRVVFFWDDAHIAQACLSPARIAFQRSALFCEDLHTGQRTLGDALLEFATLHKKTVMITAPTPDPRLQRAIEHARRKLTVHLVAERPFAVIDNGNSSIDLTRFSRFWAIAQTDLLPAEI